MIRDVYDPKEVVLFTGGPEVGQAFSNLPLDHLLFTGATSVARHIMAAAARNLVPVTLNWGQITRRHFPHCGYRKEPWSHHAGQDHERRPDLPGTGLPAGAEERLHDVIATAQKVVAKMYPKLLDNAQYTSVVNERHYQRLTGYLAEAEERGVKTIAINPAERISASNRALQDTAHPGPGATRGP